MRIHAYQFALIAAVIERGQAPNVLHLPRERMDQSRDYDLRLQKTDTGVRVLIRKRKSQKQGPSSPSAGR